MMFELPDLPYNYDALEPHIDALTMEIHHSKHHNAYTNNLNAAIADFELTPASHTEDQEHWLHQLLQGHSAIPAIRNNAGGYWNHSLFWNIMSPNGGGEPTGALAASIDSKFGSFENMKQEFTKAAMTQFGSGWAWLCTWYSEEKLGELIIHSTPNQDNPLMESYGIVPILGIDVWEHAYYKKFGPGRATYIDAWWNVVNWDAVSNNYEPYNTR